MYSSSIVRKNISTTGPNTILDANPTPRTLSSDKMTFFSAENLVDHIEIHIKKSPISMLSPG